MTDSLIWITGHSWGGPSWLQAAFQAASRRMVAEVVVFDILNEGSAMFPYESDGVDVSLIRWLA